MNFLALVLPLLIPTAPTQPAAFAGPGLGSAQPIGQDSDAAFFELQGRYQAALDAYANELRRLRRQGVPEAEWPAHPAAEWAAQYEAVAEKGSGRADLWILENANLLATEGALRSALCGKSFRRLVERHADQEFLVDALDRVASRRRLVDNDLALELLAKLAETSRHPEVAARALYEQAMLQSDNLQSEDPAVLERSFDLLRIAVDGYAGTKGAKFAAERFYARLLQRLWGDTVQWARKTRELAAGGVAREQWPPLPLLGFTLELGPLAQAGHPLAEQWLSVVVPAFEQANRRGFEHGVIEFANSISRRYPSSMTLAMDARYELLHLVAELWPDSPHVFDMLEQMSAERRSFFVDRYGPPLRALLQRSSDERIRAQARFVLAQVLQRSNRETELQEAFASYTWLENEAPQERLRREAELARREFAAHMPGAPAPKFDFTDNEGFLLRNADFEGRVVLLVFWGFWDPESVAALPEINRLQAHFEGRPFSVVGFNTDLRTPRDFRLEAQEHGIRWRNTLLLGRRAAVLKNFEVNLYPLLVLVDDGGKIAIRGLLAQGAIERIEEFVARAEARAANPGEH